MSAVTGQAARELASEAESYEIKLDELLQDTDTKSREAALKIYSAVRILLLHTDADDDQAQELTPVPLPLMRKVTLLKRLEAAKMAIIEEARSLDKERAKMVTEAVAQYFSGDAQARVFVGRFDVGSNKVRSSSHVGSSSCGLK